MKKFEEFLSEVDTTNALGVLKQNPTGPFGYRSFSKTSEMIGVQHKPTPKEQLDKVMDGIHGLENLIKKTIFNNPEIIQAIRNIEEMVTTQVTKSSVR